MTNELQKKAQACASPAELLALAKEQNYPMTAEEAEAAFARLHSEGALGDEELDNVSGGGCGDNAPKDYVKEGETVEAVSHLCFCLHCNGTRFRVEKANTHVYEVTCLGCNQRQSTGDGLGWPEADNGFYYRRA